MRRAGRSFAWMLAVAFGFGLLGLAAGYSGEPTGTIVGKVTYRGQSLPGGFVDFSSGTGKVVTGRIEPDGTFVVAGVPVGPASITVRDLSGGMGGVAGEASRLKLPLPYRSAEGSGLRHTVSSGRQEHPIDLSD
jgi:hypothetical protein